MQSDVWEMEDLLKVIKLEVEARKTSEGVKVQSMKAQGSYSKVLPGVVSLTASVLVASDIKV